jgi:S-DNA-T family DNA segregation ATPase FtsK/SpoIIIE
MAFISFFTTGAADQALLENRKIWELTQVGNDISNWMGSFGAFMAETLINQWLGISVFLYVYLLLKVGIKMLTNAPKKRALWGTAVRCMLWSIWFSLFFGFFFISSYEDTFLYLGGRHGYELAQILRANIGWGGTALVVAATFILLCMTIFKSTIAKTRTLCGLWPRLQRYRAARRAMLDAAVAAAAGGQASAAEGQPMAEIAAPAEAEAQRSASTRDDEVVDADANDNDAAEAAAYNAASASSAVNDPADTIPGEEPFENPPLEADIEVVPPYVATTASTEAASPAAPYVETTLEPITPAEAAAPAGVMQSAPTETRPTTSYRSEVDPTFSVQTHQDDTVEQPIVEQTEYDPTADLSLQVPHLRPVEAIQHRHPCRHGGTECQQRAHTQDVARLRHRDTKHQCHRRTHHHAV